MTTIGDEPQLEQQPHSAVPGLSGQAFEVRGVRLSVDTPADPEEALAAAEAVRRLANETAPRWELTPGTLGSASLRARVLDEAGALLDQLGLVHWALTADGDVLASGSAHPRRAPAADEALTPFFGTPWRAAVEDAGGRPVAHVGLAGTPGWPAALVVRHRGLEDRYRMVAVLASSAQEADLVADLLLSHRSWDESSEAAVTVRGAAALIARHEGIMVSEAWPQAGQPWAPRRG
ncbi:hypothetical protein [Galactobacter caseinivorans]|uniref:Uncharacterized protein n=1 Tax=Galactobacter caseinivorans TaxID=2676123 RepID=A0A496PIA6_9MICC|nr:hypothetical protein [Galactobacter caseinivorans]RKW70205.1 hypothetical protein DWQ67_09710 [Galactobacter caseinivorans]